MLARRVRLSDCLSASSDSSCSAFDDTSSVGVNGSSTDGGRTVTGGGGPGCGRGTAGGYCSCPLTNAGVDGTGTGSSYSRDGGGGENARDLSPLWRDDDDPGALIDDAAERVLLERECDMVDGNGSIDDDGAPPSLARMLFCEGLRCRLGFDDGATMSSSDAVRPVGRGRGPSGSPRPKVGSPSFRGAGSVGGGILGGGNGA